MSKTDPLDKLMFVCLFVALTGMVSGAVWVDSALKKRQAANEVRYANERAEEALHDQRLADEGCRKVDYIQTTTGVRAKWLCPDGTVALGAGKE